MEKCSFCGKSEKFGVRLVRGPGVAICEECVKLAAEVIEDTPEPERRTPTVRMELFSGSGASGVRASDDEE